MRIDTWIRPKSARGRISLALQLQRCQRRCAELKAKLEATEAQRDALLTLVEAVEWDENDQGNVVCPWCHWEEKRDGHAPDCAYKSTIDKARGQ